jgi:hypothetical protein
MKLVLVIIAFAIAAWLGSFAGHRLDRKVKEINHFPIEEAQP